MSSWWTVFICHLAVLTTNVSGSILNAFPLLPTWGGWPGKSVLQQEQVACRWELSSSLSWREGNHHLSCPLPLLSGKLKVGHSQKHLKLLAWVTCWILKLHMCIRKQRKNKSVVSSVILKRAWGSCLEWELVLWNLGCLVNSTGWLQFVMLIVKSCGIRPEFSKQLPLVLI